MMLAKQAASGVSKSGSKDQATNEALLASHMQMRKQAKSQTGKLLEQNKSRDPSLGSTPQATTVPTPANLKPAREESGARDDQAKKPAAKKSAQQLAPYSFFSSNPKQMYTNAVTKFAFATKTGLSPSNPNKVN